MMRYHCVHAALLCQIYHVLAFNAPSEIPTWCGKPYMSTNRSLDPGGQFQFPKAQSQPLLDLRLESRYSIFLENDEYGSVIVDASISYLFGEPYNNITFTSPGTSDGVPFTQLDFEVRNVEDGSLLSSNSKAINSSREVFVFPLSSFTPRATPYNLSIYGTSPDGQQVYKDSTEFFVLPARSYGSAVKIDNLYGGLYVQNAFNNWTDWYAILPVGAYADGNTVTPTNISFAELDTYAARGFNTINIVPGGGTDGGYPTTQLSQYWSHMDEINLFNIYDMRSSYQNATSIMEQVELWKNRTSLLMWYTADEPDGWSYPLNSTKLAYDQLKSLDPYHPVSLVLNCQDFYYSEYTSGADIVFQDAYPVAINATYSLQYDVPCNSTYGDCGCDNCVGELADVSTRLDDLQSYQSNLAGRRNKPTWSVLQAFGASEYWRSIPSAEEVENMMMLSINHNAKGVSAWLYPSTDAVNAAMGNLGSIISQASVRDFLFGGDAIKIVEVEGMATANMEGLDISAWILENKMMVGLANGRYEDDTGVISISLPKSVTSIDTVVYGNGNWTVNGNKLTKVGMKGLGVDIVALNLEEEDEHIGGMIMSIFN